MPDERVVELDWGASTTVGGLTLTCTEARHFSGRSLRRNTTLWSSWALAGPRQILLEDELSLARRYLEIEALRFGERLQVRWELPRVLPGVTVPALSIQPLVENAIRHGVGPRLSGGRINVTVARENGQLRLQVSDDGLGLAKDWATRRDAGVGLRYFVVSPNDGTPRPRSSSPRASSSATTS